MKTAPRAFLDARAHTDETLFQRELEVIFERAWLFVGVESMIPRSGDFITSSMGDNAVIVARGVGGVINVLLNICPHRGNKVCLYDRGRSTNSFECTYHGWTFATNGDLIGAPQHRQLYGPDFRRDGIGLRKAKVASFGGLIFASWDPEIDSLDEYLGASTRFYLETFFLDDPQGIEAIPGRQRFVIPGNWKQGTENFGGDMLHFDRTHASLAKVIRRGDTNRAGLTSINSGTSHGADGGHYSVNCQEPGKPPHSLLQLAVGEQFFEQDLREAERFSPEAAEWIAGVHARRRALLKKYHARVHGFHTGALWPNFTFSGIGNAFYGKTLLLWKPVHTLETEIWQWCVVPASAPPAVKKQMQFIACQRQGAAGLVGPDDTENFTRIADSLRSSKGKTFDYFYAPETEPRDSLIEELPGQVVPALSDFHARRIYEFWRRTMFG
jgi:phenylpropionate dioxygenase-like ring-hydroxylating dioxygenase large terminal subunit